MLLQPCDGCAHRDVLRFKAGRLSPWIKVQFDLRPEDQCMRRVAEMKHANLLCGNNFRLYFNLKNAMAGVRRDAPAKIKQLDEQADSH